MPAVYCAFPPFAKRAKDGARRTCGSFCSLYLCSLFPVLCSLFSVPCLLPLGNGEAAVDLIPVHHVPPCGKVIGTLVLVLQVVGVLPHIVAKNRKQSLRERRVLVCCGDDLQLAAGEDEPSPAGAELLGR